MKSNCTSMKEMQQLMAALREVYTDVRLLDAETLQQIQEGARTDPHGPDFCYACRHKDRFSRHCAARQALADRVEHCRLEICGDQAAHITAWYYEVDGQPYVLELTKSAPLANIIDAEDSEALMSQASGHNMRFYHDPLTGVYNRRYYEDVARASIGPAGVSILDMDNLKVYNDTYGRQAGDLALGTAANVIRGCIRQTDTLIRYGGDKFLLILPGIPREHPDVFLQSKLEQIRATVEETTLPGYPHLHLSLSIGAVLQGSADPLEEAVHRADSLMYQAKAKKNAIVLEVGPLTLRERNLRRLENFEDEPLLQTAYDIARWHHERWDGQGYPDGLKGNDIPISAQIVSLADVYDALTSERCYKKAFSHETAMRMILNGECGAFNPLLLECLTDIQAELQEKSQNIAVNR